MASTSKQALQIDNSEFPTNWDIDKYRTEYDSEEHWELRRKFMEAHKERFPEERLVCLAQVFFNIEFLGCKYPQETMRLVAELAKDVAKDFRDSRSNRLKRTFVGASEAAEQRVKGRRNPQQQKQELQSDGPSTSRSSTCVNADQPFFKNNRRPHFQTNQYSDRTDRTRDINQRGPNAKPIRSSELFNGLPYGRFVLLLIGGRNCISISAQRSRIPYEERATSIKAIEILLNNKRIADSDELSVKASKAKAFQKALNTLQRYCYTIKPNPLQDTIKIDKKDKQIVCDVVREPIDETAGQKLDANNKGYKMMKQMGWTGGGLGSTMQGREDPVSYLFKNNRAGLGNSTNMDKQYFRSMLQNYVNSDDIRQLQFESTFTKDERAALHEIAARLNLRSVARGHGETRFLTINKKNISEEKILTEVLINKNPKFRNKYFVQVPENKRHLYPDHTRHLELD